MLLSLRYWVLSIGVFITLVSNNMYHSTSNFFGYLPIFIFGIGRARVQGPVYAIILYFFYCGYVLEGYK